MCIVFVLPIVLMVAGTNLAIKSFNKRNPLHCRAGTLLVLSGLLVLFLWGVMPLFIHVDYGSKQGTCTQNLNQIGKAFRMYASDWDDTLPANLTNGLSRPRPSSSISLGVPKKQYVTVHRPSSNFVEALSPYLEKLEDTRGNESVWRCPQTCERQGLLGGLKHELPGVTYCMNWYMTGQKEGSLSDAPSTLLVRELGKPSQALLRPYPTNAPDAQHPRGTGPPAHIFPAEWEFGADTVGPVIHSQGSIVLLVDGHVWYRPLTALKAKLVSEQGPNGSVRWHVGEGQNRIWITP